MRLGNVSGSLRSLFHMLRGISTPQDENLQIGGSIPLNLDAIHKAFLPIFGYGGRLAVCIPSSYVRTVVNETAYLISNQSNQGALVAGIVVNVAGTTSKISLQDGDGNVICELSTTTAGVYNFGGIVLPVSKYVTSGAAAADVTIMRFDASVLPTVMNSPLP